VSGGENPGGDWRAVIGLGGSDDLDDIPTPTARGAIAPEDASFAWEELRSWVERLASRFGALDHHVIPRCWWRHNGHVEALVALRDHERSSCADTAPATAPLDWIRALRDASALLRAWTAESGCGTTHQEPPTPLQALDESDWAAFVARDVERRRHEGESPAREPDGEG
jgi:hypothetical protein